MEAKLLPHIDLFQLSVNLSGKRDAIAELLTLFLSTAEATLQKLEAAQRNGNVITWLQTLHQLKGSAHNIRAKRLAGLCLEAEQIREMPHDHSEAMIYHMRKELAILREAIHKHLETML